MVFDTPFKKKKKDEGESNKDTAPDTRKSEITPEQLANPVTRSSSPYIKDSDTGNVRGVKLPDGRTFSNLTPREARRLMDAYNRKASKLPQEEETPPTPVVQPEAQPTPTSETIQQQGIGQIDESLTNQTTADIERNQALGAAQGNYNILSGPSGVKLPDVKTNPAGIIPLGKVTSTFIKGSKASFIKNVGLGKDVEAYLSDYSNEGSFESVRDEIALADAHIKVALESANVGEDPAEAIRLYNAAQSRRYLALRQLKLLSKDKKAYVADVRAEMTKLETYFADVKKWDDAAMARAVQKAVLND